MNPWEVCALQHQYPDEIQSANPEVASTAVSRPAVAVPASSTYDPLIYPGLYSATGFDVVGILLAIVSRPNPQVDLGPIDASCPIIVCDLKQPDQPIVYASDAFLVMTGYSRAEILGQNCRFLQAPGGKVKARSTRKYVDEDTIRRMRQAIDRNCEVQVKVVNFKKDGSRFVNLLSMVPVRWQSQDFRYSVGFQCEWDEE